MASSWFFILHLSLTKISTSYTYFEREDNEIQGQALFFGPEGRLNPLNAELNAICHLLAFLGAHHILHG